MARDISVSAGSVVAANRDQSASAANVVGGERASEPPPTTYEPMSASQEAALKRKSLAAAEPALEQKELVKERTRMSRTFTDPVQGTRVTEISASPINFKNDKGDWTPIVNKLKPNDEGTNGGWTNGANEFALELPKALTEPVTIADATDEKSFVSLELAPDKTPVDDLDPGAGQRRGAEAT